MFSNNYKKNIVAFALLFTIKIGIAQDLHFSQQHNSPLLQSPANTGFLPDNNYRFGINYRNQWASLSNPYKTFSAFADWQMMGNKIQNGWLGGGVSFFNDVAGTGNLQATKIYGSLAYHQLLGDNLVLSAGINGGYVQKQIDLNKLSFDNQWNTKFFDINLPVGESFSNTKVSYVDFGLGVNLAFFPNDKSYVNGGISALHVNQPNESFFTNANSNAKVPMRFNAFVNGSFKIDDNWIINPNAYFSQLLNTNQLMFGANAQRKLNYDGTTQIVFGGYYRLNDAIVPMLGINYINTCFTFSYDAATTPVLSNYAQSLSAYELSIIYKAKYKDDYGIKCPSGVKF